LPAVFFTSKLIIMAAVSFLNVGYAVVKGGQGSVRIADSLRPNVDGTGDPVDITGALMAIFEIIASPMAKSPRLFVAPESLIAPATGAGLRSIGMGEVFKVAKATDTNTEGTFSSGVTFNTAASVDPEACAFACNEPCTVMVTLYS
jgi:hypothetical protein